MIADNEAGLLFKNKRDRKVINVDPSANPGDNSTRTEIETSEYVEKRRGGEKRQEKRRREETRETYAVNVIVYACCVCVLCMRVVYAC